MYPERFSQLPEATWPRLRALLDPHAPGGEPLAMTIGEPQHPFPQWLGEVMGKHMAGFGKYPDNNGLPELRNAAAGWIDRRYGVTLDPDTQIMALNGTREGLFNAALALGVEDKAGQAPYVLTPNPFYQVYAVAALAAGSVPYFVNADADTGHLPDFAALDPAVLDRTSIVYICSPANPQGAVATADYWAALFRLAEQHDFLVFADECYSEIYRDTPPPGALQVADDIGADPERLVVFHSLSKRSNVPGLRSGFVASGPQNIARIKQLRAFAGAPLPEPVQHVSAALWADEDHVVANRQLYCDKFVAADHIFAGIEGYRSPEAGFFLWLPVPGGDGEEAARTLWRQTGVRVLPGAYLSRDTDRGNPGKEYIRVALVAPKQDMQQGLCRIRDCIYQD